MSNFMIQEYDEEEQFQGSTIVSQSSNGSPNPTENGVDSSASAPSASKKKRNLPGNPDPNAEVVALSPRTLMATNRYICEVCHKGFQRDQNLQLHRRGHNLPWKLKQRPTTQVKKRVYVCPEPNCVHHDPSRALGDLTGIKKHFCRKHGEKKWKCDKCSKRYAVQSDWKAHSKICGTREYRCDCGTIFSRKDSFVTHRAFCDALTEENYKVNQNQTQEIFTSPMLNSDSCENTIPENNLLRPLSLDPIFNPRMRQFSVGGLNASSLDFGSVFTSATALLQKAAEMGSKISDNSIAPILLKGFTGYSAGSVQDGSLMAGNHVGPIPPASANGIYSGRHDQEALVDNGKTICAIPEPGLFESSVGGNLLGGEKMTLDFLGVEPPDHSSIGNKRNYDGMVSGVGYSNMQQTLQSEW
ncbi:hypothetical protein ACFE04_024467 [Oxalis oulophora]